MINNFLIRAIPKQNQLQVILDGYFLKSEIELAYHLAKKECKKLTKGFEVKADLRKFQSSPELLGRNVLKMKKLFKLLGGRDIRFIGISNGYSEFSMQNVGFYPYENGWFF